VPLQDDADSRVCGGTDASLVADLHFGLRHLQRFRASPLPSVHRPLPDFDGNVYVLDLETGAVISGPH
jgi:hypothetical protein